MNVQASWQACDFSLLKKLSPNMAEWLIKPERLTRQLKKSVKGYQLILKHQGLRAPTDQERAQLQTDEPVWERCISHQSESGELIHASVVTTKATYLAFQADFDQLRNQSIGDRLFFNDTAVTRSAFEYAQVDGEWARRSTFTRRGHRILVTEFFTSNLPLYKPAPKPLTFLEKIMALAKLMRLHKPLPILLALWPTYWGLWLAAGGLPPLSIFVIFTLGGLLMRSAGCIANDIADRRADRLVERTQHRPITDGKISVALAGLFAAALALVAYLLVLQCNALTVLFAWVGLALTLIYPLLKRITHLPQLGLGFAFNWGLIMAFAAVQNTVPGIAWLWYAVAIIWTLAYDTIYAYADVAYDKKIGIKSTAVLFGKYLKPCIFALQSIMLCLLAIIGVMSQANGFFYLGLPVCLILFLMQHHTIKTNTIPNCIKAFSANHWVGLVVFVMILVGIVF